MKNLLLLILIIIFNYINCQNKVFKYDFEYKPNPSKDSIIIEKTVLNIKNGDLSIFRSEHEKKSDSLMALTGFGLGKKIRFEDQFYIIKKLSKSEVFKSFKTIFNDFYFVKINEKFSWTILPEKSKIGNFEVQKAKVNYGGRTWIAWFTNEIPIQDGPYVFNGLPGLIINISDDKSNFIFNLTEIKNADGEIYYRPKGVELTWEKFKRMAANYYSDPLARIKLMNVPYKVDDGNGNAISPNMKIQMDKIKKQIRENNNPIELDQKISYELER